MIDLHSLSLMELYKLNIRLSWEITTRIWWVWPILIVAAIGFFIWAKKNG